jgi:hypothetical protein
MKTNIIKNHRKLWEEAIKTTADDNEEILVIAQELLLSLRVKRGKPLGIGFGGVLEILANLGVYLNEQEETEVVHGK